jgi:hypothetical protein
MAAEPAFFMIQGSHLRWGLSTARVQRITREGEAELPPHLLLPDAFLLPDEGSVGQWTLIVAARSGPRSLLVSRFLELVPAEQVSLQPLPALCRAAVDAPVPSGRITHVALAATSDDLLFLLFDPCA